MNQNFILNITWGSILRVAIIAIVLYFLYRLENILAFFIAALIISILFDPLIDFFHNKRMPRFMAVAIVYSSALAIFIIVAAVFLPFFFEELRFFYNRLLLLPEFLGLGLNENGLFEYLAPYIEPLLSSIKASLAEINILRIITSIVQMVINMSIILALAVFFSLENKGVEKFLKLIFPQKYENSISVIWRRCSHNISAWFGIRVLSCLFVGAATLITLFFLGAPHPFILAFIAGLFNFILYIGPLFSGIFIGIVLFVNSPALAIIFITIFIIIQFLENNILMPVLMKKIIRVPASIVLLSVVIGATLWGVLGAILAVPLFGIIFDFSNNFLNKRRLEEITNKQSFSLQSTS